MFTIVSTILFAIAGVLIFLLFLVCAFIAVAGCIVMVNGVRGRDSDTFCVGFVLAMVGTVCALLFLLLATITDCDENWWPYHALYDHGERICVAQ